MASNQGNCHSVYCALILGSIFLRFECICVALSRIEEIRTLPVKAKKMAVI